MLDRGERLRDIPNNILSSLLRLSELVSKKKSAYFLLTIIVRRKEIFVLF